CRRKRFVRPYVSMTDMRNCQAEGLRTPAAGGSSRSRSPRRTARQDGIRRGRVSAADEDAQAAVRVAGLERGCRPVLRLIRARPCYLAAAIRPDDPLTDVATQVVDRGIADGIRDGRPDLAQQRRLAWYAGDLGAQPRKVLGIGRIARPVVECVAGAGAERFQLGLRGKAEVAAGPLREPPHVLLRALERDACDGVVAGAGLEGVRRVERLPLCARHLEPADIEAVTR